MKNLVDKYITQSREPFFEIAKELIDINSIVLDIGAGDGEFAEFCGRNDFYLIDGNIQIVNKNKNRFTNYTFGILPLLPFSNQFFDVIHCSHVIEHLEPQTFYDTLKEMNRCLKYQGFLVISTPMMSEFFYDDLSHVKPYNPAVFIKYLTNQRINNLTRTKISEEYLIKKIVYRYKAYRVIEGELPVPINWVVSFLFKIGCKKYKKTGFTIVLKKKEINKR